MKINGHKSLDKIITVLGSAPEGLWIREIGRRAKVDSKVVSYFVSRNPDIFEEHTIEGPKKPLLKVIRLKKGLFTRPGMLLTRILKEHG